LLKSGASFKKDRVEKLSEIFNTDKPEAKKQTRSKELPDNDNDLFVIDQ